jgi:site-specific DNA-methyltransferase (cytosine-N4-specific)
MIKGHAEKLLLGNELKHVEGKVQLIFTSPPFALNKKKRYGNYTGNQYIAWLSQFAPLFNKMLTRNGSIVIELGNAWIPGRPAMSTLALEALLAFKNLGGYHLCQEFICHNPAKLPTPAEWVTVQRIRLKDSYTRLWWLAKTDRPKANNRNVLQQYSASMQRLLKRGTYNAGRRPSEHHIGQKSFLNDHGGAIPPNVLTISNTASNDDYQNFCKKNGLAPHPARMPAELAEFFIRFLTSPGDWVLDPFGGSNTTGAAAETLGRRWVAIEPQKEYIKTSRGRFKSVAVYNGGRLRVRP